MGLMEHLHLHPPVRNVNEIHCEKISLGDRIADRFAQTIGSWTFIIIQTIILISWIALNVVAYVRHWDPYPFILLNLALSFQAAYSAPIIMMSQNRQAEKDRLEAENDYHVNLKAEEEIKQIMEHLVRQDEFLIALQQQLIEHLEQIGKKTQSSN